MNKAEKRTKDNRFYFGKRKTAIARAKIREGTGKITINKKPFENFHNFQRLSLEEPIRISKKILGNFNFDIEIEVKGGGNESQIDAAKLAIAKALVGKTKSVPLRKSFLEYDRNLLIADVRRKEAYKPGDSKARRKRAKSYR